MKSRRHTDTRGRGASHSNNNTRRNESSTIAEEVGLDDKLPLLKWDERQCNYAIFKEKMSTYLQKEYGNNGSFIINDEYYEVLEPEEPDADGGINATRRERAMWALYEDQLKNHHKLVNKYLEQRTAMYSTIWGQLSRSSKDRVKQHYLFPEAQSDASGRPDPLILWRIIVSTHIIKSTGSSQLDRKAAKDNYERLRQSYHESLSQFKERFDYAIEALVQTEHPQIPEIPDQVIHFISALNESRHHEWKTKTLNEIAAGHEVPESVVEAYELCDKYRPINDGMYQNNTNHMTTYMSRHNRGRGRSDGRNSNRGSGRGYYNNKDRGSQRDDSKEEEESNKCYRCGATGHYANECTFSGTCNKCGKTGHKASVCRSKETKDKPKETKDNKEVKTTAMTKKVLFHNVDSDQNHFDNNDSSYMVHIDNQSNENIFRNDKLLLNIRDAEPVTIQGIAGEEIICDQLGDFMGFEVYYSPKAIANILSWNKLSDHMKLEWNQDDNIFKAFTHTGEELIFNCIDGGLYVCDFSHFNNKHNYIGKALITTVQDNLTDYTTREINAANEARKLTRLLGCASPEEVKRIIRNGTLLNNSVTSHDVDRAINIWGKDIAGLKGKTTRKSPIETGGNENIAVTVRSDQDLHMDIMFVDKLPFLVSKATPLNLVQVSDLKGKRHASVIRTAFQEHHDNLKNHGYNVINVFSDSEGGIDSIQDYINKVAKYQPVGPDQHEPVVERTIRTIKERVRSVLNSLPFTLPSTLLHYLISYVVRSINMIPNINSTDNLSPREKLLGRKTDVKIDLRIEFGQYVQARVPNIISNSMSNRTEGCIALLPKDNLTGSVKFLNLSTFHEVTRDQWQELPMPDIVIERLNAYAEKQTRQLSKDPVFVYHGNQIITDDDNRNHDINENNQENTMIVEISNSTPDYENNITDEEGEQLELSTEKSISDTEQLDTNYRGDMADDLASIDNVIPEMNYEVDEDGDIIMDDSEAIFYATIPKENEIVTAEQHRYNLREHRSNWKNRVFITAIQAAKEQEKKFCYRTSIAECKKKLGNDITMEAVRKELQQMLDKCVWDPVKEEDLLPTTTIIPSMIFMKEKYSPDGKFEKLKARIVAGGHRQNRELYSENDIASPTASIVSVLTVAAIAAEEGREVVTGDIPGAYLHATIQEDIYMIINKDMSQELIGLDQRYLPYARKDGSIVVKLKKALYGCVESAKLWFEYLRTKLYEDGFQSNAMDQCIFNKNAGHDQCTIALHVDDMLVTAKSRIILDATLASIDNSFKDIKWNKGDIHNYLGITFKFNRTNKSVSIRMTKFIEELVKKYAVDTTSKTPCGIDLFDIDNSSPVLSDDDREHFHSAVATCLFLAQRSRPDILLTISFLSTRVQQPTEQDKRKLRKLLAYIYKTQHIFLTINGKNILNPYIYIDSSYGSHSDGKGHTGCIEGIGGGGIHFSSKKQRIVCKSSMEAEVVGISDSLTSAICTREFLKNQGYKINKTTIFQDNEAAIAAMLNGGATLKRSKHINIRNFWIKDQIDNNEFEFTFTTSENMLADLLTKPIVGKRFFKLRSKLLNLEPYIRENDDGK